MKIGKGIRYVRKQAGLTQQGLADRIGITDEYVSNIETGKGTPSLSLLQSIAKACNVSPVVLFIAATDEGDLPEAHSVMLNTKIEVAINIFKNEKTQQQL